MKGWFCAGSLALLITLTLSAAHAFDKTRTLRAATLEYPPYEYLDQGQPTGIAVDLLREATKRLNLKDVSIDFRPWKRAVSLAQNGSADVLFNAGKNEARQEWGYFASSVLINQTYYLFTRKQSELTADLSFQGMSQQRIAVRRGYLYGSGPFRKALDGGKFKHVVLTDSVEAAVRLLLNNRVDMFVGDYLPVMHYLQTKRLEQQVGFVQEPGSEKKLSVLTWPTYYLFSKQTVSPDFVLEFDRMLDEMKADGTYAEIFERYSPGALCEGAAQGEVRKECVS